MAFEAILASGERSAGLAEHHRVVSEALVMIAGNVRSTATVLAVLERRSCAAVVVGALRNRSDCFVFQLSSQGIAAFAIQRYRCQSVFSSAMSATLVSGFIS